MKYCFFNIVCLLGLVNNVFSQNTIIGVVQDEKYQEGLPFVQIVVEKEDTILSFGTEIDGTFTIPDLKKEEIRIIIRSSMYADYDTSFHVQGDTLELNIKLEEDDSKEYGVISEDGYLQELRDLCMGKNTLSCRMGP